MVNQISVKEYILTYRGINYEYFSIYYGLKDVDDGIYQFVCVWLCQVSNNFLLSLDFTCGHLWLPDAYCIGNIQTILKFTLYGIHMFVQSHTVCMANFQTLWYFLVFVALANQYHIGMSVCLSFTMSVSYALLLLVPHAFRRTSVTCTSHSRSNYSFKAVVGAYKLFIKCYFLEKTKMVIWLH